MAQYHIENDLLSARVGTRGAALLALRWRAEDRPLIVEFRDPDDPVLQEIYAGVIVGPVANRVATPVTCAGDTYDLPVNEPILGLILLAAGASEIPLYPVPELYPKMKRSVHHATQIPRPSAGPKGIATL